MSFWGQRDSLNRKSINLKLQSTGSTRANNYLNGKHVMLLLNQDEVKLNPTNSTVYSIKKAGLHWSSASPKVPMTTLYNF